MATAAQNEVNREERPMEFFYNLFYRGRLQDHIAKSTLNHYASTGIIEAEVFMMMAHLFGKSSDKIIAKHFGKKCVPWLEVRLTELTDPREVGPAAWAFGLALSEGLGPDGVEDHVKAHECFRKSADVEFAAGLNNIGNHYRTPKIPDSAVNNEEALRYYRMAAAQGHASAKYNIGDCYYDGDGVEQSYTEAARWYLAAALDGHVGAQNDLAYCYDHGLGVPENPVEAVRWFRHSAQHADAEAAFNLAVCYETGRGMPHGRQDHVEALRWYRASADEGNMDAMVVIGAFYEEGRGGVQKNLMEAAAWYRRAADLNHADGQISLGISYENGDGVDQNFVEAARLYRLAAEQNSAQGQSNLASCYARGIGVTEDLNEAAIWYLKAARWDRDSQKFVPIDDRDDKDASIYAEAKYWYGRLLQQHRLQPSASNLLSENIFGTYVEWFQYAAEEGCGLAQYGLVLHYLNFDELYQEDEDDDNDEEDESEDEWDEEDEENEEDEDAETIYTDTDGEDEGGEHPCHHDPLHHQLRSSGENALASQTGNVVNLIEAENWTRKMLAQVEEDENLAATLSEEEFLYRVIKHHHISIVMIYCELGINLDVVMETVGFTPLEAAVDSRYLPMVELLLDYGVNMTLTDVQPEELATNHTTNNYTTFARQIGAGQHALAQAYIESSQDIASLLLNHGADLDSLVELESHKGHIFRYVDKGVRNLFRIRQGLSMQ